MKCLAGSAAFHGLLAVALWSGSALHWRPRMRTGAQETGSGIIELVRLPLEQEPRVPATTAANRVPQPPTTPPVSKPRDSQPAEPTTPNKPSSLPTTAIGRRDLSPPTKRSPADNPRLLELSRALEGMAQHLPSGKTIELDTGSSSAGKDDAYARIVRFFYSQSWEPAGNENADPKTAAKVTVTISSDGKVSSARIIEPSGDARLDESVRQTLDRVQFIEPFEPGAKESERTYTINFSLRSTLAAAN